MIQKYAKILHVFLILLLLNGCDFQIGTTADEDGNGGSGGSSGSGEDGGASIGVLTDARSLEVNFASDFSLSNNAEITLDGEDISSSELENGMVVSLILEETVPEDLSTGTVTRLQASHLIIGPVTQVSPLQVLNHEVTVLDETELDGIQSDDVSNLDVGDIVRVSGYTNRRDGILATRIDTTNTLFWKMTGSVDNVVDNDSFEISGQNFVLNGVIPDCPGSFSDGDFVEVMAGPIPGFNPGDDVDTTLSVECITQALPALSNDDEDIDEVPAEIEGFIIDSSSNSIDVGDQEVDTSENPTFVNGRADDMVEGAKVEVEGMLDLSSGDLVATRINFLERRFYIEAPLDNEDINVNSSINLLGIEITTNNLVFADDDDVVSSGIAGEQVVIHGFVDDEQNVFATSIELDGTQELEQIYLLGPVSQVGSDDFELLGVSVDGSSAESLAASIEEEDLVLVEDAEQDGDTSISDGEAQLIESFIERDDR